MVCHLIGRPTIDWWKSCQKFTPGPSTPRGPGSLASRVRPVCALAGLREWTRGYSSSSPLYWVGLEIGMWFLAMGRRLRSELDGLSAGTWQQIFRNPGKDRAARLLPNGYDLKIFRRLVSVQNNRPPAQSMAENGVSYQFRTSPSSFDLWSVLGGSHNIQY